VALDAAPADIAMTACTRRVCRPESHDRYCRLPPRPALNLWFELWFFLSQFRQLVAGMQNLFYRTGYYLFIGLVGSISPTFNTLGWNSINNTIRDINPNFNVISNKSWNPLY
jgi:hypothetical protein